MILYTIFYPLLPLTAVAIDLLLGDPREIPHPVQFIGKFLNFLPQKLRLLHKKVAGFFAVIMALTMTWVVVAGTTTLLTTSSYLIFFITLYWCYAGLALGSLLNAGRDTLLKISSGSLEEARFATSMLVSRETKDLNKYDLYKTLAETLSENMNDGVIAPFFWLCIGSLFDTQQLTTGILFLWMYKTVSTMDSMWGYKNEQWKDLGFACAKLDDFLAYIPARLTGVFLIWDMHFFRGIKKNKNKSPWISWSVMKSQAQQMESPNAGIPMATAAWIEGASMGGATVYEGISKNKPYLGPAQESWTFEKVQRLINRIRRASLIGFVTMWSITQALRVFLY